MAALITPRSSGITMSNALPMARSAALDRNRGLLLGGRSVAHQNERPIVKLLHGKDVELPTH